MTHPSPISGLAERLRASADRMDVTARQILAAVASGSDYGCGEAAGLLREAAAALAVPPSIPAGGVREADGDYELAETIHGELVQIKPRHSLKEQTAVSTALVNELRKASSLPFPLIGAPIMADAASRIEDLEAENGQQTADISEFMQRLGPRWFLEQGWFPESVGVSDAV